MLSLLAAASSDLGSQLLLNASDKTKTVGATYGTISVFINLFVKLAFLGAGIILLFLLIGGGFGIIASGGDPKNVEKGKDAIMGAVLGFFVVFCAFWIIQIIQVITGVPILNSGL